MAAAHLPKAQTLPRLPKVAAETSFDALRAEGIRRVQALAGTRWTDYNLHDPGVTLLEAACFALTEEAYRVDFVVADHLSDEHDRIDWDRHGLLLPQQAFPCRPTTATDLRRALLDQLPVLDGVTLQTAPPGDASAASPAGVLHLLLDAGASSERHGLELAESQALELAVRQACAAQRNLGEDLGEVRVLCRLACQMCGEIAIGGSREPAEIVAELLESCTAYMASTVDFDSAGQAVESGQTLDRVFECPTTLRGIAQTHRLMRALEPTLFITDLIARVPVPARWPRPAARVRLPHRRRADGSATGNAPALAGVDLLAGPAHRPAPPGHGAGPADRRAVRPAGGAARAPTGPPRCPGA
ncbi:MAG TPA: hypothetical protein VLM87_00735 [Rubrivivax sp.]|nr:hypothetical protein [Rubrivivax sp.]